MLAVSQLCNARQQQACSLLQLSKFQSTERFTQVRKPLRNILHVHCSSANKSLELTVQRAGRSATLVKQDILVVEASDWEHPVSHRALSTTKYHVNTPGYIEAELTHATKWDTSVFQRAPSQPWTCANAPKYIAPILEEWEDREVKDSTDAVEWLMKKLRLRDLTHSTIRTYYTAFGIQQFCNMLCLGSNKNKDENIATLKSALSKAQPLQRGSSYNTLQLAS